MTDLDTPPNAPQGVRKADVILHADRMRRMAKRLLGRDTTVTNNHRENVVAFFDGKNTVGGPVS